MHGICSNLQSSGSQNVGRVSFDRKTLTQFWLSVTNTYPTRSTTCIKISYNYPTPLPLQPTRVSADVEEVITQNRKQVHCSHTPHYASDK
ncbi:hypothetical protein T06_13375 [Trichinella sp. T6]|nr:hypothetical protein T06_13375 [Trichinella sp. T6]